MLGAAAAVPFASGPIAAAAAADDWEPIAREYDVTREVIQLEHGNWGMMARPALASRMSDCDALAAAIRSLATA